MQNQTIVITGASAGIGAALANLVSQRGAHAVLVARRQAELDAVAKLCLSPTLVTVADVTKRSDVEQALARAIERFGQVDVWVNNAGRGMSRNTSELTDDDLDEMMLVNVKSALYGMQTALTHFKTRGRGHIVNISSLLGRVPIAPFRSAYCASKHALNSLTANLRMELRQDWPNIHVSSVHPGVVATEFGVNAKHGGPDSRLLPGAQSPEDVALVIAETIEKPRADVYTRAGAHQMIAAYYAAEDMGLVESQPPYTR